MSPEVMVHTVHLPDKEQNVPGGHGVHCAVCTYLTKSKMSLEVMVYTLHLPDKEKNVPGGHGKEQNVPGGHGVHCAPT